MPIRTRVLKSNNQKVYDVRVQYKDRAGNTRRSSVTYSSLELAKQEEQRIKREINLYGIEYRYTQLTIKDIYHEWKDYIESKLSAKSSANYLIYYNRYIKDAYDNLKLNEIDMDVIDMIVSTGINKSAKEMIHKGLFNILRYSLSNGYIGGLPQRTPRPKKEESLFKKVQFLKKELDQSNNEVYSIVLLIGYYTGLSLSHILSLQWSDIDFENKVITVKRRLHYTRNSTVNDLYTVPINQFKIDMEDELAGYLVEWKKGCNHSLAICIAHGKFIHPHTFNARIKRITQQMDLDFTYNDLKW